MKQLSSAGQQAINDIAQRHGFTVEATLAMLDAVLLGNGSMAQFDHPEFGGAGQWMRGGMTMVSDMFNSSLKGWVDALCLDLSNLVASHPDLLLGRGSFQSQSQSGGLTHGVADWTMPAASSGAGLAAGASLFGPETFGLPATEPGSLRASASPGGDVFTAIEKLAALKDRGILDAAEFAAKKSELLKRV